MRKVEITSFEEGFINGMTMPLLDCLVKILPNMSYLEKTLKKNLSQFRDDFKSFDIADLNGKINEF